jgi:acyl-coenzyme A thioesterase 13
MTAAGNPPSPFARLLGMEFGVARPGYAEVFLDLRPELMNFSDVGHGAVAMALMDTCCGVALGADEHGNRVHKVVTVSFTTGFLAPMLQGRVTATARVLGGGRRTQTCASELRDAAGTLLATGSGVFQYIKG